MKHSEAVAMICHEDFKPGGIQAWADLGCGTGIFTTALAELLEKGSHIAAIDNDAMAIRTVPAEFNEVSIEKKKLDFEKDNLALTNLDGILMANSLHYVADKALFFTKMKTYLRPNHCFLIIEYDIEKPNPWAPFPVPFAALKELFTLAGYRTITKLHEKPSLYNRGNIYSAIVR